MRLCRACARRARFLWRCVAWRSVSTARWAMAYEQEEDRLR
jgi:hypothetical protein